MRRLLNIITYILIFNIYQMNSHASISDRTEKIWDFVVFLDETPIGEHVFKLTEKDTDQQVNITANLDVRFLLIPVYSYSHKNTEIWSNNCLINLQSETLDNGLEHAVSIDNSGNMARITTLEGTSELSTTCLRSFAYWNPELLKTSTLINAQNGEPINIELRNLGTETLSVFDKEYSSIRYQLTGENIHIDLWYTADNEWLALESKVENGSILRYQLTRETLP